jgi:hypothetical protein
VCLHTGFNVLLNVCVSGLISKYTLPHEQGLALGTLAAVQSIVSVLGPASERRNAPFSVWLS